MVVTQFGQRYVEIVGVGYSFPRLTQWRNSDPSDEVQYWSPAELCPVTAHRLVNGISSELTRLYRPGINQLLVRIRVSASAPTTGSYDARAVLMFGPGAEDEPACVDRMRSIAATHLAGLWRPHAKCKTLEETKFLRSDEAQAEPEALANLSLGALLGTRIPEPLRAVVPDRPPLEFTEKFRNAPVQSMQSETFEVSGRLLSTKSSGRYRSVSVWGQRAEVLGAEFKHPKVLYDEAARESIARAVSEPSRRLRMSITQTTVPNGRLKPLVTYTLNSLRFEERTG